MSLRELDMYVQGYVKRIEAQQELAAWHAANIMQMWTKKGTKITPGQLLGRNDGVMSPQELARQLNEQAAQQKVKKGGVDVEAMQPKEVDVEAMYGETDEWVRSVVSVIGRLGFDDEEDEEDTSGDTLDGEADR